jgi:predicted AAA+ superfamily ATPase
MEEKIFKRKLEDKIKKFVKRKEIIGIRGARQTGKTTLLKMIEKGITGNKVFINLDLVEYRRALEENVIDFIKRFKRPGEKLFLFLDEIQKVKDGGEKLKIIFDEFPDVKTFISGSSSLELKTNVLPPLVGRLLLFELLTFDFEEYLSAKDEGLARLFRKKHSTLKNFLEGRGDEIEQPSFVDEFLKYWKEYAIFGGYPEVVKAEDEEEKITILKNIFNLYLEKDILTFFRIEETSKFEDLLKFLAFNVSNLLSISSIASDLRMSHRKIDEFLTILQHTYIIHFLKPFYRNLATELKKSPKAYFLDLGLRNSTINNFSPFDNRSDNGQLTENFVLRELISSFEGWKINYWRTTGKAEIDFVLRRDEEIIPVEVKLSGEKLGKSFHSFLDTYRPEKAIIVTLNKFLKQNIGKTTIYWVPVFYF